MRLHVAFLPHLVWPGRQVSIVIDVIRASTSLITLVDRGASRILIASDVSTARILGAKHNGAVLAGEQEGLAPPGFDYGNSPVELSRAVVADRPVIFVTTNGTAAIHAVEEHGPVLVGALRNSAAVTDEAWETAAGEQADLTVVCAGREGAFGIDDAYTAGYLASRLMDLHHGWTLTDSTDAALRLFRSEPDPLVIFRGSAAGQNVNRLGLAFDVDYCAERNRSSSVPRLGRELAILE
ncbi:MAG TPA: 2-phosphosulfolactate phosphatase [bacterium]|nr:2-phosphosulfolactate phosphatase [bacterium]